jgi:uncharacterized protein YxjI
LANDVRFCVQGAAGEPVFDVYAVSPDALVVEGPAGGERCIIHEATYGLQRLMRISRGGQLAAWVHKVVFAPLCERYSIDLGHEVLGVHGRVADQEYDIRHGQHTIAAISQAWGIGPESCGLEIAPDRDKTLIVAITLCLTLMSGGAQ